MKGTLAVAAREISERKLVLFGALLVGVIPLAIPLLPGLGGPQARDVRFVTALFLSLTIFVAFPIVFGATVLVSEITQKRIAFYFSRPLSAASIWAGKMLAVFVISVSGACIAAIPTILFDGKRAFAAFDTSGPAAVYLLLSTLLLIVGTHILSSMVRLRSAWIVLDFLLAALFAVAVALSLRGLFLAGFWNLYDLNHSSEWLMWWLAAPFIAALLVATHMQVAEGRTDTRRSHGALSATLWGLMTLLAIPLAGLAWWVSAATPKDLVATYSTLAAPRGSWVGVSGPLRARGSAGATFLYDTVSGHFIKRQWERGGDPVEFSADGTRAAWLQGDPGFFELKRTGILRIADLGATAPAAIVSDVEVSVWVQLALSPSGRRVAVLDGSTLAAYEISDPSHARQILASRREKEYRSIAFVGENTIRLSPRGFGAMRKEIAPRELEIEEVNLLPKKFLVTGQLERDTLASLRVRISADGRHLVETRERNLTLHDGRTGALLATLSEDLEAPKIRFLSEDRIVVAGVANRKAILKIFLEGERESVLRVELGPAASVILGAEIAPGRVAVALNSFRSNDERAQRAWKLAFVDVATGAVSPGPDGLAPADRFSWWQSAVLPPAEAGTEASTLFLDANGRLVRLDPATGAQTVLLGRSK
jgi:hypothetical protein